MVERSNTNRILSNLIVLCETKGKFFSLFIYSFLIFCVLVSCMCLGIVADLDTLGFLHCWFFSMVNNCVTSKSIGMATKQKQAETAA